MTAGGKEQRSAFSRREALSAGTSSVLAAALVGLTSKDLSAAQASAGGSPQATGVKALTFDVFGTVVDWRSSIIREGQRVGESKGLKVDWARFADRWAAGYGRGVSRVREGKLPWTKVDRLLRVALDELLEEFTITGLTPAEVEELSRVWQRLSPWPDAVPGLKRLRSRYIVATLSNGNVSLLVNLARHAGLPWDCVLSSELARHYKPDRQVYEAAAALLGLPPEGIMMVASHKYDLHAAERVGFRTAWVTRPMERGPGRKVDTSPDDSFDITASDFVDLARKLGV